MKSVITALILSVAVLCGSVAYTHKTDEVTAKMYDINSKTALLLEKDDFSGAGEKAAELKEYIESSTAVLETLGNHEETDKIKMNLSELERFIWGKNRTDALAKCGVLDFLILHLRETSHLTVENIL